LIVLKYPEVIPPDFTGIYITSIGLSRKDFYCKGKMHRPRGLPATIFINGVKGYWDLGKLTGIFKS
jgi:hypothetical protein